MKIDSGKDCNFPFIDIKELEAKQEVGLYNNTTNANEFEKNYLLSRWLKREKSYNANLPINNK